MNLDLLRAILAGTVPVYNLSVALDFGAMPEGWPYWEQRARDGLDDEAREKLAAIVAAGG
jgi:hypothetical protein